MGAAAARSPRLNPFAFPSSTGFRFALLVASVLGTSILCFSLIHDSLPDWLDAWTGALARCQAQAAGAQGQDGSGISRAAFLARCEEPFQGVQAVAVLVGMTILMAVALGVLWALPGWRLRRTGLVPFTAADSAEIRAELDQLSARAGLARAPTFVWNPLTRSGGAWRSGDQAVRTWP
ncbi:MAG: hypothetical protein M3024_16185 [Candidatus Dormibacteraeota bacterium]|nr:hypothetical protein [Candidatus Dormibacteraeota bacterium]